MRLQLHCAVELSASFSDGSLMTIDGLLFILLTFSWPHFLAAPVKVSQGVATHWTYVFYVLAALAAQRDPEEEKESEHSQNYSPGYGQTAQVVLDYGADCMAAVAAVERLRVSVLTANNTKQIRC